MAADDGKTERDALKGARAVLRGIHAAERQLLSAGESTTTHQALDALAGLQRVARSSGAQAISAKYAARMAALGAAPTKAERDAMRQKIKLEEAEEMARFNADQDREASQNRQTILQGLAAARKSRQRALSQKQRLQQTALALMLSRLRPHQRTVAATPRPSVRRLAARIPVYRAGAGPSDGMTTQ